MTRVSSRTHHLCPRVLHTACRGFLYALRHVEVHPPLPAVGKRRSGSEHRNLIHGEASAIDTKEPANSNMAPIPMKDTEPQVPVPEVSRARPVLAKRATHKRVRFEIRMEGGPRGRKSIKHIGSSTIAQGPKSKSIPAAYLDLSLLLFKRVWSAVFTFIVYHAFYKWLYVV